MDINWDNFKCRCSSITKMMSNSKSNPVLTENQAKKLVEWQEKLQKGGTLTENQHKELAELKVKEENGKKIILSDTCIEYLMDEYSFRTTGKFSVTKELDVEYFQRGKLGEEDAITLLSRVDKVFYRKNTERVYNDFLSGEPDIYHGESIMTATRIEDIKNTWDYPIFLKKINKGLDNGNEDQVAGYMDITGAGEGNISFTLVNMPESIINDYRRRLMYKMDVATDENPEYKIAVAKLEHSMRFDDIPIHKRVYKIPIARFTPERKQMVYDKVKICREWLFNFHEQYQKLNLQ